MDFNKAHQKELAKFERALRRSIAETQARNAMYRMPQSTNFTFSDIVDRCNADSSGLPEYFSDFLRKVVEQGKIIQHATGPKRLFVLYNGKVGRNNRPTNLYKFEDV